MKSHVLRTFGLAVTAGLLSVVCGMLKNNDEIEETKDNPDDYTDTSDFGFPVECNYCDAQMVHTPNTNLWICPECGNQMVVEDGQFYYEHSKEDDYSDYYDDMPECCKACGNGAFPDCMNGCSIIED